MIAVTSCSVYKSPDRKDFESYTVAANTLQNLKPLDCSYSSLKEFSTDSKLISVHNSSLDGESVLLWKYLINHQTVFESDNLKGVYCIYEKI